MRPATAVAVSTAGFAAVATVDATVSVAGFTTASVTRAATPSTACSVRAGAGSVAFSTAGFAASATDPPADSTASPAAEVSSVDAAGLATALSSESTTCITALSTVPDSVDEMPVEALFGESLVDCRTSDADFFVDSDLAGLASADLTFAGSVLTALAGSGFEVSDLESCLGDSAFEDSAFAGFASDVVLLFADSWAFDDSALDSSSPALSDLALFAFSALGLSAWSPESLSLSDFLLLDSLVDFSSLDLSSETCRSWTFRRPNRRTSRRPNRRTSHRPSRRTSHPTTCPTRRRPTSPCPSPPPPPRDRRPHPRATCSPAPWMRAARRPGGSRRGRRRAREFGASRTGAEAATSRRWPSPPRNAPVTRSCAGLPLMPLVNHSRRPRPTGCAEGRRAVDRTVAGIGQGVSFQDGGTTTNRTLWPGRTCAARSTSASQTVATTG